VKRIFTIITWVGLCIVLGCAAGLFAQESIYTWTDENGVVHISNRKPNRSVRVQDVEHYNVPQGEGREQKPQISVDVAEPTENQKRIERYEKAAREAEEQAEAAARMANETQKAADGFRDKLGNKRSRWRKNRSRIKKLDEQARLAREQARKATENARAAREAANALKQGPTAEAAENSRPQ